jgi:Na+/melibiose symporter-like transporter
MIISPLFDFILGSVTHHEVGSASGVLNAVQQLAGALGVAVMGTIFFATLTAAGFVSAIERCLLVELASTPVLLALVALLPARAREPEHKGVDDSAAQQVLPLQARGAAEHA